MLFKYKAITKTGEEREGTVDAISEDVAIASLQRRELIIINIASADDKPFLKREFNLFGGSGVSNREVVILSRQIATLFAAQVSALRTLRLLATETESAALAKVLTQIADDIQAGTSLSSAFGKHGDVFSDFYVNMIRAGEESGKLNETFTYMADYLDRSYELTQKTKNALIYPAFVIATFIVVMILMLTLVIPKLAVILKESGQDVPIYTKVVIGVSDFLTGYGLFLLPLFVIAGFFLWRFSRTAAGKRSISELRLDIPYIGSLYRKLYLSRISDNMHTMLSSGISMVRAIEVTATVVGNDIFKEILEDSARQVRSGSSFSDSLSKSGEIPSILIQMIKIGEETGELDAILNTLAQFYKREVDNAVDTLIGLIEPAMIVALGLGVGLLLTSVLIPIYNVTANI